METNLLSVKDILNIEVEKSESYTTQFYSVRQKIQQKEKLAEIEIETAHLVLIALKCKTMYDNDDVYWYNVEKGIWEQNGEKIIRQICHTVNDRFSTHNLNEIIDKIKRMTYIEREEFDPPWLIGLQNGVAKIEGNRLVFRSHSPDNMITRAIPVFYNKNAECEKINAFLNEITSKENKRILEEAIGYCLLNAYPFHRAFLLFGPTHTGKSTFLNVLKHFLGEENTSTITLQQIARSDFYAARLKGKMANLSPDLPSKAIGSTGLFKALTGEDRITANIKNKDMIEFKNTTKLFFSANEIPPSLYDDSSAYYVRWIIIDCQTQFLQNCDPVLIKKLTTPEEMSGLFNLAIKSLINLISRGYFEDTIDLEAKKKAYIMGSDPLKAFVYEKCDLKPGAKIPKGMLYTKYTNFCRKHNRDPKANNIFTKELKRWVPDLDTKRYRIAEDRIWHYINITINPELEI